MNPELADALQLGLLGRLMLAALLGGLIGLERELRAKPAGLRTNLLICMGSALLMEISVAVAGLGEGLPRAEGTRVVGDPGRIAAQIVSGIGFLGAGTILQSRGSIIGLTTAATIWVVAAIGMAVGSQAYVEAIGSAVLVVFTLVLLGRLEDALIRRQRTHRYSMTLEASPGALEVVEVIFREAGLKVESESFEKSSDGLDATLEVSGPGKSHDSVIRNLISNPGILRMTRVP